jgi:hypothetical protein
MEFFNDIGSDPLKPSLFELIAQEQLRDLLQPTLKYVLAVSLHAVTSPDCVHLDCKRFLPIITLGTSYG